MTSRHDEYHVNEDDGEAAGGKDDTNMTWREDQRAS